MNLTGSQSRKTVYEVRVYLYEPMWFKNNKTSLFLMHNPAVVMNVMRAYTHRLGLTLILTGMEIPETPQADAQKVPRALPAHKHTQIKAPTQTLPQHIRSLRTEASCRQLVCRDTEHARRLVDLHKHTHYCPSLSWKYMYCTHPHSITLMQSYCMTSKGLEHDLCCMKHFPAIDNPAFEFYTRQCRFGKAWGQVNGHMITLINVKCHGISLSEGSVGRLQVTHWCIAVVVLCMSHTPQQVKSLRHM